VVPDTGSLPDTALAPDSTALAPDSAARTPVSTALAAPGASWRVLEGLLPDSADLGAWPCWVDLAWVLLWLLGLAGIVLFGRWEVIPFLLMAAMVWVVMWHGHRKLAASAEHVRVSEANQRLIATQRRFLQDAAHQLRTPITIALGHAELLARSLAESQDTRDITVIVGELNRLRKLSERLLMIAASASPDFLLPEPVALDEFTAEVLWRWRAAADRKWLFGRLDDVTVRADRERLGLAVDALLENAVQHTAPGDVIRLSVFRDDRGSLARLVVTDGGAGIAPADIADIFDRFATGTASNRRRGTGLGLSLVRAIARGHGGEVQVSSTVGIGSTFAICLPSVVSIGVADSSHELAADPCGSPGAR
jgi:signal transduction histidine kinase